MKKQNYYLKDKDNLVGIVVLNYMNFGETIKCVDSLLLQKNIELRIVIVENGSKNDSAVILKKKYAGCSNVKLIVNNSNLGYAKGNNIGISYLRNQGCNFIFVANSDLLFSSENSLSQIIAAYEPGIGLINPIIKNLNNSIDQRVSYRKDKLYLRMIKKFFEWLTGKSISISNNGNLNSIASVKEMVGTQTDRYIIAGSGFLLTSDFFEKYNGLYPETFLYCEEWATIMLLHKANLSTKVANCEPIIHKGGASTPKNVKEMSDERRKICFDSWKALFKLAITSPKKAIERY